MGQYGSNEAPIGKYAFAIGSIFRDSVNLQLSDNSILFGFKKSPSTVVCPGNYFRTRTVAFGDYLGRVARGVAQLYGTEPQCPLSQYGNQEFCLGTGSCPNLSTDLGGIFMPTFWFSTDPGVQLSGLVTNSVWMAQYDSYLLPSVSYFFAMAQLVTGQSGLNPPNVLLTVTDVSSSSEPVNAVTKTLSPIDAMTAVKDLASVFGQGATPESKFANFWANACFNSNYPVKIIRKSVNRGYVIIGITVEANCGQCAGFCSDATTGMYSLAGADFICNCCRPNPGSPCPAAPTSLCPYFECPPGQQGCPTPLANTGAQACDDWAGSTNADVIAGEYFTEIYGLCKPRTGQGISPRILARTGVLSFIGGRPMEVITKLKNADPSDGMPIFDSLTGYADIVARREGETSLFDDVPVALVRVTMTNNGEPIRLYALGTASRENQAPVPALCGLGQSVGFGRSQMNTTLLRSPLWGAKGYGPCPTTKP